MRKKFARRSLAFMLSINILGITCSGCSKYISTSTNNETIVAETNSELVVTIKGEEDAKKTEEERLKAEAEAKKAEEDRIKAEEERLKAEADAKKAEEERLKAEAEAKKAEEDRIKAEKERLLAETEANELTPEQQSSINMLNYMTVLTQEINISKGNQLFLESARNSLYNDTNLNAVDTKTQDQINQLVLTIDQYRMTDVKRERLEFIYEQNQAQALREAIPNPTELLNAVESDKKLEIVASVVSMAVDSVITYQTVTSAAELQFIKRGWVLDDADMHILQNSTTEQFNYMCNMVRDYDLPDEYVVRDTDVKNFVEWSNKTNLVQKIDWLTANETTYQKFGPYWLELAKNYYEAKEWKNCLAAVKQYEELSSNIIKKDSSYANVLPMAIIAAKKSMAKDEYIDTARRYATAIKENTKDEDWIIRYFVAQIYLDIYAQTKQKDDLEEAYKVAYYNVNTLVDYQRDLNKQYLNQIQEIKAPKGATKRVKEEIKQYNQLLKDERKIAVPPVSEALYLNCDLLFAIAEKSNITQTERNRIESLLHENGDVLFLTKALDNKFRMNPDNIIDSEIEIEFDGEKLVIPAICISDRSKITVEITDGNDTTLDDWEISEVERTKEAKCEDHRVVLKSKKGKEHKYQVGEKIKISVVPVIESPDEVIIFKYDVVSEKKALVFNGIGFERK